MRYRIVIATTALAIGLTACGSTTTVTTTPVSRAAGSPATSAPAKQVAKTGDAIALAGQEAGEKLTVTLKQWSTSVSSTDGFSSPNSGKKWFAAQFEIKNSGTTAYSDSPDNCAQAADAQGERFPTTLVSSISNGPMMTSDLKLAPGDTTLGWLVFEVPSGATVTTVQFTPDSGMADATGQWAVK